MPMESIIKQQSAVSNQQSAAERQILTETGFFWRERNGVKVLVCLALEDTGFVNGFSTRIGGVSPFPKNDLNLAGFDEDPAANIAENRRRFLAVFGGDMQLATVWQVHGHAIKTVKDMAEIADSDERADAIVSDLSGFFVGVKTADCVPILIGDPRSGAFAAVHAGWRGTVQSIVKKAISQMYDIYGTNPKNLICAIGPAASGENYEIGGDVINAFAENFANSEKYFRPTRDGHALVDLHLTNRDQLVDVGVRDENIFTAPFCTMERPDLFFSYRLEKRKYGKIGRLLSVIGRPLATI